ncbi:MAG TPA: hypothetical protein VFZ56_03610 [Gemmatimonadaceae bacterium]
MKIGNVIAGASLALVLGALSDPAAAQGQGKGRSGEAVAQGQGKARNSDAATRRETRGRSEVVALGQGQGQGKGQGKGQAKGQTESQGQAKGQAPGRQQAPGQARAAAARAAAPGTVRSATASARGRFARQVALTDVPASARQLAGSKRPHQVIAAGALARAHARGADDEFRLVPSGDRVSILNREGDVLLNLDDDRARNLGRWDVNVLHPELSSGAPSFCRSGAGHPVWGRQWCLDKGFGLGDHEDVRWGRTTTLGDIIFGRTGTTGNITNDVLPGLIGNTAYDRLALHAMTLGYTEPLTGVWGVEPTGRRVLLVNSGPSPVAEIVDVNRDNRADLLLVALRQWLM